MLQNQAILETEIEPLEREEELLVEDDDAAIALPEAEDEDSEDQGAAILDAESLFSAELRRTRVLSRQEESTLARQIVQARNAVRRHLRQARRLSRMALADFGRGLVAPDEAFRERETIVILTYAKECLRKTRPEPALGMQKKELRAFVAALSGALEEYRALRDQMLQANIRLVSLLARRYHHPTLTFLDLVQEGTMGLIRAIEKYEPGKNVKFSTYAVYWIWQQLSRAADTSGSLIRTPVHWNQMRRRVNREVPQSTETAHTHDDLADSRGIDPARLELMSQTFRYVSTDAPASEDDDRTLETMLASDQVEPEEQLLRDNLRERLDAVVGQLPDREAEILRRRFGLVDDESETLDEIGVRFNVSRERIRQLETRALGRLKNLCVAQGLREYLQ